MRTIEIDNLILVEVPKDAVNFELGNNLLYGSTLFFKINNAKYSGTDVIKGNFEIIGLIETPNLDFDFEVDDIWVNYIKPFALKKYKDYMDDLFTNITKKQSFRTRIQRKIQDAGLYLVNPYGKKPKYDVSKADGSPYRYLEWRQAEEKTIKGNLLLIKKLK